MGVTMAGRVVRAERGGAGWRVEGWGWAAETVARGAAREGREGRVERAAAVRSAAMVGLRGQTHTQHQTHTHTRMS